MKKSDRRLAPPRVRNPWLTVRPKRLQWSCLRAEICKMTFMVNISVTMSPSLSPPPFVIVIFVSVFWIVCGIITIFVGIITVLSWLILSGFACVCLRTFCVTFMVCHLSTNVAKPLAFSFQRACIGPFYILMAILGTSIAFFIWIPSFGKVDFSFWVRPSGSFFRFQCVISIFYLIIDISDSVVCL